MSAPGGTAPSPLVSLHEIARIWLRLGITGFGGPPAHIVMLRRIMLDEHDWLTNDEFEHAVATTNLLPGPASTQLAIFCGWRLRATRGALVAGMSFILPGLIIIIALAAVILSSGAPSWLTGAAVGAGAVVPAVALRAASDLARPSLRRSKGLWGARARWVLWVVVGAVATVTLGGALVFALLACGAIEVFFEWLRRRRPPKGLSSLVPVLGIVAPSLGALWWLAIKVGLLSFGGGFVIVPLMENDAVHIHHWMTGSQFLAAVALGQLTPGPVVQTVAVVGYAAGGVGAALAAAGLAFAPSFLFVIFGGATFERLRTSLTAQGFLAGAGPAAIGAIGGSAFLLGAQLHEIWQIPLLFLAAGWLLVARRGTVSILCVAACFGACAGALGLSVGF